MTKLKPPPAVLQEVAARMAGTSSPGKGGGVAARDTAGTKLRRILHEVRAGDFVWQLHATKGWRKLRAGGSRGS